MLKLALIMKLLESFVSSELSLVLGVDGSGKTTFMRAASDLNSATVLEPTANQKAKEFKQTFFDHPITPELVDRREQLFTELNRDFDVKVNDALESTHVLTSGSLLVTRLSHFAMREVISIPQSISVTGIVDEWLTTNTRIPERVVYLHAPTKTIQGRLLAREMSGDTRERPFGYNSPFFLDRYNKVLGSAFSYLYDINPSCVAIYDTSLMPTAEIIDDFLSKRIDSDVS